MSTTPSLQPGLSATQEWTVEASHLYNPTGKPARGVLSSPTMIGRMEGAAVEAVRAHLPPDTVTVGFHVDVKHIAPARQGARMTTTARLTAVDGNKLSFDVEAREGDRLVGTGKHRRAIISAD